MKTPWILAIILLFAASSSHAASANEAYILGPGAASCGLWTSDRQNATGSAAIVDASWVLGFISAYNRFVSPTGNIQMTVDRDGLFALVDQYCAAHPLASVAEATDALIDELKVRHR
jgi:hypothetical protein